MNPVRHHGELRSGAHAQRVQALAGALAEAGFTELEAQVSDVLTVTLRAREADLPGYLLGLPAGEATLRARSDTLLIITPECIAWATGDDQLAAALRRAPA